jgi:uncharacterized phage-associated protein
MAFNTLIFNLIAMKIPWHRINNIDPSIKDKVGNILIYLSTRITPLFLTKALKLLYFIDEESVKESGAPITGLKHEAWRNGPVSREVFIELHEIANNNGDSKSLSDCVEVRTVTDGHEDASSFKIIPKKEFDNSEFSRYELEIIDKVIEIYGNKSASRLIDLVHEDGTPYSTVVEKNNLKERFKNTAESDFPVDLYPLVANDDSKRILYLSAQESFWFNKIVCK